jgi:hypothetical protein
MINDLHLDDTDLWKYVDDTTTSEIVPKGSNSNIQVATSKVENRSLENKFELDITKCMNE